MIHNWFQKYKWQVHSEVNSGALASILCKYFDSCLAKNWEIPLLWIGDHSLKNLRDIVIIIFMLLSHWKFFIIYIDSSNKDVELPHIVSVLWSHSSDLLSTQADLRRVKERSYLSILYTAFTLKICWFCLSWLARLSHRYTCEKPG